VSASGLQQRRWDHEAALRAIAHPGRRRALELAAARELSSGDIAAAIGWSRPAASQHLRVLRDAALVDVSVRGNQRLYRAHLQNMRRLRAFLDNFWGERLRALEAELDARKPSAPRLRSTDGR
jgi:DNA-binding transcriptional ArsR family regulator